MRKLEMEFIAKDSLDGRWKEYTLTEIGCMPGSFFKRHENWRQFVGWKDSGNVKIFDGDIVEVEIVDGGGGCGRTVEKIISPVVYDGCAWRVDGALLDGTNSAESDYYRYIQSIKVIGNVFDNPELLKDFVMHHREIGESRTTTCGVHVFDTEENRKNNFSADVGNVNCPACLEILTKSKDVKVVVEGEGAYFGMN